MSKDEENNMYQEYPDQEHRNSMGLPPDYFTSFSSRLFKKMEAEAELKNYPLLSSLARKNVFAVPSHYFEIREEQWGYPVLSYYKALCFHVPANYFEDSISAIQNKMDIAEEIGGYDLIAGLKRRDVFITPDSYFEKFSIIRPDSERVARLFPQIGTGYRIAIAASVALIIVAGAWVFWPANIKNDCTTLACLSQKEIISSVYVQSVSEENIIEMIDERALEDSLSLKKKGSIQRIKAEEVSEEIDLYTLTEEL
jgi:hypothetical protein